MTTITITGFIHVIQEQWDDNPTYTFMSAKDMSKYGYTMVCQHTIEVAIPADFNPVAAEVAMLEKTKEDLADDYHIAVRRIDDRIKSLLCIGHTVEVDDEPLPF